MPPGWGGSRTAYSRATGSPIEALSTPSFWSLHTTGQMQAQYQSALTTVLESLPGRDESMIAVTADPAEIMRQITQEHKTHFDGISSRLKAEGWNNPETLVAKTFFPRYGGSEEFLSRQLGAVSNIQSTLAKISAMNPEAGQSHLVRLGNGELVIVSGTTREKIGQAGSLAKIRGIKGARITDVGGARGTEISYKGNRYQGAQGTLAVNKQNQIVMRTHYESVSDALERAAPEMRNIQGAKKVSGRLRDALREPLQTISFMEGIKGQNKQERQSFSALTQHHIQTGQTLISSREVQGLLSRGTIGKSPDIAIKNWLDLANATGDIGFSPELRQSLFGVGQGFVTARHVAHAMYTGIKEAGMLGGRIPGPQGAYAPIALTNLYKPGHELGRGSIWGLSRDPAAAGVFSPLSAGGKGWEINTNIGGGEGWRRDVAVAKAAGGGIESPIYSVTGDALFVHKTYRKTAQGLVEVPIGEVPGLGGAHSASMTGSAVIEESLAGALTQNQPAKFLMSGPEEGINKILEYYQQAQGRDKLLSGKEPGTQFVSDEMLKQHKVSLFKVGKEDVGTLHKGGAHLALGEMQRTAQGRFAVPGMAEHGAGESTAAFFGTGAGHYSGTGRSLTAPVTIGQGANARARNAMVTLMRANVSGEGLALSTMELYTRAAREHGIDIGSLGEDVSSFMHGLVTGEMQDVSSKNPLVNASRHFRKMRESFGRMLLSKNADPNKVSNILSQIMGEQKLKFINQRIAGEDFVQLGQLMPYSMWGKNQPIHKETKLFYNVGKAANRYEGLRQRFWEKIDTLSQYATTSETKGAMGNLLAHEYSGLKYYQDHEYGGTMSEEVRRVMDEHHNETYSIVRKLKSLNQEINIEGKPSKVKFKGGLQAEYERVLEAGEYLKKARNANSQHRPVTVKLDDILLAARNSLEMGDEGQTLAKLILLGQGESPARFNFQSTMRGLMPLYGNVEKYVEETGGQYLLGGRILRKNKKDMQARAAIAQTAQDIESAMLEARRSNVEFTERHLSQILNTKERVEQWRAAFGEGSHPEQFLTHDVAYGVNKDTLANLTIKQELREGGEEISNITLRGGRSSAVIVPAYTIGGREFSHAGEQLAVTSLRAATLSMHTGIARLGRNAADNSAVRDAYGNLTVALLGQMSREGTAGKALEVNLPASAFLTNVVPDESIMGAIRKFEEAGQHQLAAEASASVDVSRATARAMGFRREAFMGYTRKPGTSPTSFQVVRFKVNERMANLDTSKEIMASYGIQALVGGDTDADKAIPIFFGDIDNLKDQFRRAGYNKQETNTLAHESFNYLRGVWSKQSAPAIYEMHKQVIRFSEMKSAALENILGESKVRGDVTRDVATKTLEELEYRATHGGTARVTDTELTKLYVDSGMEGDKATHDLLKAKLQSGTRLGSTYNKLSRLAHVLDDFQGGIRKTPIANRYLQLAQHFLQMPYEAAIIAKKGGLDSLALDVIDILSGTNPKAPSPMNTIAEMNAQWSTRVMEGISEALTPKTIVARHGGVTKELTWEQFNNSKLMAAEFKAGPDLEASVFADIRAKAAYEQRNKAHFNIKDYEVMIGLHGAEERKNLIEGIHKSLIAAADQVWGEGKNSKISISETVFAKLRTKAEVSEVAGGGVTVAKFLEHIPSLFESLNPEQRTFAIDLVAHMQGLGDIAKGYDAEAVARVKPLVELLGKEEASRFTQQASEEALNAGASKGIWGKATSQVDKVLTHSPRAKWLLAGATVAATTALTAGMFINPTYEPSGTGPVAPPATPRERSGYSVQNSRIPSKVPMEPTFDLSNRYVANGSGVNPEIAAMRMKMNVAGDGNFSIMDQSMNSAQFSQQYESMSGGRF